MSQLRRVRINAGFSIEDLARASGVSADQIRNLEEGRSLNPRVDTLGKLAGPLKVLPADIDPKLSAENAA